MLPSPPPHLPAPLTITFICRWLVGERCRLWPGTAKANRRVPEDPSPGLSLISVLWFPNMQVSQRFSMPRRDLRGGMFFPTLVTMPCPSLNFKVTKLEHIFSSSKWLFLLHSLFLSMNPATSWPPAQNPWAALPSLPISSNCCPIPDPALPFPLLPSSSFPGSSLLETFCSCLPVSASLISPPNLLVLEFSIHEHLGGC